MTETVQEIQVDSNVTVIESLENLILENLDKIEDLSDEAKKHKEMIDSALLNDETYKRHDESAKEAANIRKATRQEIMKQPDNSRIALKEKEIKAEIKDIQESMNSYLGEYKRLSGSNTITNKQGKEIIIKNRYGIQGRLF